MSQRGAPPISFQLRRQVPTGGSFKPASPDRNRITPHVRCDVWVKLHLVEFVAQPERRFEGAGAFDGVWADAACGFATRKSQAVRATNAAHAHTLASEDKIGITQFSA